MEEVKALTLDKQKLHLRNIGQNPIICESFSLDDSDFACTEEEKRPKHDFYTLKK